jgi:hypothetical protein
VQIPTQRSRIPCFHPDNPVKRSDAHQSATSIRTTWQYRLRLHSSERHGNTFGRSSEFQKNPEFKCISESVRTTWLHRPDAFQCSTSKTDFFPKNRYGKTTATVRTMSCSRQDAILDKASRAEDVQASGRQTPWSGRSGLNMEIVCSRSATVRTRSYSGKNINEFEKPVAQLFVQTSSTTVRTTPRENQIRRNLGFL